MRLPIPKLNFRFTEFQEVHKIIRRSDRVLSTFRGEIYAVLAPPGEPPPPRPFEGVDHRRVGHVRVRPQEQIFCIPRSCFKERCCTCGQQIVDVSPSPHLRYDADVEDGQEGRWLCRHHQPYQLPPRPVVSEPPPRGHVLNPSRVLEELARRLLRAESLALLSDLAVDGSLGNPSHRVDERFVPDFLQRTKGQSSGLHIGFHSPPLEAVRLPPEGEPNASQQLYPLLRAVLELGLHRRSVEDVLYLLGAQPTRFV